MSWQVDVGKRVAITFEVTDEADAVAVIEETIKNLKGRVKDLRIEPYEIKHNRNKPPKETIVAKGGFDISKAATMLGENRQRRPELTAVSTSNVTPMFTPANEEE